MTEVPGQSRSLVDAAAKLAWRFGSGGVSRAKPVFISGPPRSGTTWVLETLENMLAARRHWEPINDLYRRLDAFSTRYGPERPVIDDDGDLSEIHAFVRALLDGAPPEGAYQARNLRLSRLENLRRLTTANVTIIKFVFAQRLLPWIASETDARGIVLLRSPFSIVASRKTYIQRSANWADEMIEVEFSEALRRACPPLEAYHGKSVTRFEAYALDICIDVIVPVLDESCRQRFVFTTYEALTAKPSLFVDLAEALGLGGSLRTDVIDNRPSATTRQDSNVVRGGDPNQSWRRRLEPDEIAKVAAIMQQLEIDFYSEDGTSDATQLTQRGLRHLVC